MNSSTFLTMLLLPSLETEGFIAVANITEDEARQFNAEFESRVSQNRKTKDHANMDYDCESLEIMDGNIDLKAMMDNGKLKTLVETLQVSNIHGARGRRPVFIDVDNGVIGVGQTVVYNRNWAMFGVRDSSVPATILTAAM